LDELKYVYFLKSIKGLGEIKIKKLISRCRNFEQLKDFLNEKFPIIQLLGPVLAGKLEKSLSNTAAFEREFDLLKKKLESSGIKFTTIISKNYPENLKQIPDPPVILYYKGKLTREDKYSVGVVGTRAPTQYGQLVCENLTEGLSKSSVPVISGMAIGVDSIAHSVALRNSNITYAVLGSGVDVVYPYENSKLYKAIIEHGAVISEYEPGVQPDKTNFPARNRIISGISIGVLIIESGLKGGSLITANFALDQNKEVFAVPGNITSNASKGTNELIKRGMAKPVTEVSDIFEELEAKLKPILKKEIFENQVKVIKTLNEKENKLFSVINDEPLNIDQISEVSGFNITDCLVNLLSLEFKGVVKQLPGKNFIRSC
jgi:DNA protecting protein DprA